LGIEAGKAASLLVEQLIMIGSTFNRLMNKLAASSGLNTIIHKREKSR